MSDELIWVLAVLAIAVPCVGVSWVVWTGRALRSWYRDGSFGPFAVTFLPAWALSLLLIALGVLARWYWPFIAAPVVFVAGLVLQIVVAWRDPTWAQPPWFRELGISHHDPAEIIAASLVRRRPSAHHEVLHETGAVLVTDDEERPASTTTRFGWEGRLWVLTDQIQFLQHEAETLARGDRIDVLVDIEDLDEVAVTQARPSPAAYLRLLGGDSRGRVARPLLRLRTDATDHVFHVHAPAEVAAIIEGLRRP